MFGACAGHGAGDLGADGRACDALRDQVRGYECAACHLQCYWLSSLLERERKK
jgi:hypothetical protein